LLLSLTDIRCGRLISQRPYNLLGIPLGFSKIVFEGNTTAIQGVLLSGSDSLKYVIKHSLLLAYRSRSFSKFEGVELECANTAANCLDH